MDEKFHALITEKFIEFHNRRLKLIRTVSFADAYNEINPLLLWLNNNQNATMCIREAFRKYLDRRDEALFRNIVVTPLAQLLNASTSMLNPQQSSGTNGPTPEQLQDIHTLYAELAKRLNTLLISRLNHEYEIELAVALNRELMAFLPAFCQPNGHLNWVKLINAKGKAD